MSNVKYNQSAEDYLECLLMLSRERQIVHRIDVAKRMEVSQAAVNKAVKLLCEKGHISELSEIIREYDGLEKLANRTVEARIYYVNELSEAQKTALVQKLEAVSGKKVCATYIEDTALIGGIRVEYDDKVIDGSLANRMKKIKGVISE